MKLNGRRLEKRSPRKITKFQPRNWGQKTTTLQLTRVKSNGVSIRKPQLEKSKPAKFSQRKHRNTRLFRRITRPFIRLLIVPFTLQRLVREKFHFKKKNPTFCCAGVKRFHFKFSRGLERSVRGVRMGNSGPLERVSLTDQIQGFRIPDRWDAQKKIKGHMLIYSVFECIVLFHCRHLCGPNANGVTSYWIVAGLAAAVIATAGVLVFRYLRKGGSTTWHPQDTKRRQGYMLPSLCRAKAL